MSSVTILRSDPGRRAAKRVTAGGEAGFTLDGYDLGKHFAVTERHMGGLGELAAVLDEAGAHPRRFVLRGEPLPGIDRGRCRRLLHVHEDGTPPTFRDVPRRWVVIDFDEVPGPYRFDPGDGELAAIHCRSLLPPAWQRCSCWWGLSSSAGFRPGVRIKLAFWLDRPVLGAELERHLSGCPIDPSTLRAVQPIYVARPILVGVDDPIARRTGLEEDVQDLVTLPELPAAANPEHAFRSPEGCRYVSGVNPDVAAQRLAALCGAVERAGMGGRHRCLIWAAARAIELDDALPRAAIAAELIASARRAGLQDSEADLARQVRNGFKIGIFGDGGRRLMDAGFYEFKDEPGRQYRPGGQARGEQPIEWPEPIDILADPELTGVATVAADCLPESILALATAEGARLQVDPAHMAALAIGVTSAVIPDAWKIRLKVADKGWIERPCIWVAVVAESGRRKTDCFRSAARGVTKVEFNLREQYREEMNAYLQERRVWDARAKAERGEPPAEPVEPRLATDDFTPEVLADLLQTSNKVLLRSDELATMLGAYERYSKSSSINAGRAHMLALYDGGPRRIDRVQRGKIHVENWSAVPVGHIQPAKVRELVESLSDDGLLQRFMLVLPPRVDVADPEDDDVATDWTAIDRYAQIVEILHALQPPQTQGRDGRPEPGTVDATPDVYLVRRRLFRLVERIEADPILPAPLKEAASKWRGLLARLSLVFHVVELAERRLAGERQDPVAMRALEASTIEKACRFIMRVVVPSTFRFHDEIGANGSGGTHARWIAGYLLSRKLQTITARDIGRAYGELRGKERVIGDVMEVLDHAGWVARNWGKAKGAEWTVNPKVHEIFATQAAAEKARRDAVRATVKTAIAELAK